MIRNSKTGLIILFSWLILFPFSSLQSQTYEDVLNEKADANFYEIRDALNEYYETRDKGRGSGYKQFKRWELLMESRVYPSGEIVNPYSKAFEARQELLPQMGAHGSAKTSTYVWTPLGPTSYTLGPGGNNGGLGRINVLAFDPQNPNIQYAGSATAGLWRRIIGGSNWECISTGLGALGVSGIALHPTNNQIIYLLSGDGNGTVPEINSQGVFKTTDGGITWLATQLAFTDADDVEGYKLAMHPTNANTLFAVTDKGIRRTTNGGQTWQNVQNGAFFDLEFKPGSPSTIYASTRNQVYVSNNGGGPGTWTAVNLNCSNCKRTALGVGSGNPNRVYAIAVRNGLSGIYRSENSGLTFPLISDSKTPNLMAADKQGAGSSGQGFYDLAIAISGLTSQIVDVGGINHWRSEDSGDTWTLKSYWEETDNTPGVGYTHADIHDLVWAGSNLYCASDGGVFRNNLGLLGWSDQSTGLNIHQVYRMADLESNPDFLYFGTQDNGTNKYDGGPGVEHQLQGDGTDVVIHPKDPNIVYSGQFAFSGVTPASTVVRTTNGGISWPSISPSLTEPRDLLPPLEMDPHNPDKLYLGFRRIYKSVNGGNTWTNSPSSISNRSYKAIKVAKANTNWVYAVNQNGVLVSSNGGSTWNLKNTGLPISQAMPVALAITTNNPYRAYVGFSGYADGEKVYMTVDGGDSWFNVSAGIPNVPVNDLEIAQTNGREIVFAATDMGVAVYNSNYPFLNFNMDVSNFPLSIITDLEYHNSAGLLRAATLGRGVWELPFVAPGPLQRVDNNPDQTEYFAGSYIGPMEGVILPMGETEGNASSLNLYPNPARERSIIDFEITQKGAVSIRLMSSDGTLIRSTSLPDVQPGRYRTAFELKGLPKGIYFVNLGSKELQLTKKLVVQ